MLIVFLVGCALAAGLLAWFAQWALVRAFDQYRDTFKSEAHIHAREFFLFIDPGALWGANLAGCLVVVGLVFLIGQHTGVALGAGALALLLPRSAVAWLRARRLARLDEQMPDLILALAGALRAGSGMQTALRHMLAHAPNPLAQELGLVMRQQRMGLALDDALAGFYQRVPTEGAGLLVSALNIAMQSGGNLAETLERIASTLRARLQLANRVRALTSQGRLQAWAMALLPGVLALVLDFLDPDAMALLWHTPAGWAVLVVIAGLEMTGILFIRRIVSIRI